MNEETGVVKDKALQILQTLMLLTLIGGMGWTVATTLENSRILAKMEALTVVRDAEMGRIANVTLHLSDQVDRLRDVDSVLDRRLTVVETKGKGF